jgi:acetyl esterase
MERPFRLDSELAAINVMIPRFDLTDAPRSREIEVALAGASTSPGPDLEVHDETIDGPGGPLAVRVYRPARAGALPALLYVHGGAFMLGGLHTEDERCQQYAIRARCIVVQVDYRLAPEHRFPAPFEDVSAALAWMVDRSDGLGIDVRRIAIGGNSAGGTIAAAVALACRHPDAPDLVLQLLINPALDCRQGTSSVARFTDSPVFTAADNALMWRTYLGDATPDERASPSLAADLRGVAPARFWLAEFDPLRDEGYEYALRLMQDGTSVGILQYPGTFHGFDSYRMTRVGRRAHDDQVLALTSAFT